MELLHSWQCSLQIVDDNDDEPSTSNTENAFTIASPTAEESISQRPVWDLSPLRRHEEQEGEDDDYAWYYKHPERIIWRPRRSRLIKSRWQKDKPFTVFDFLLKISRDSWSDGSVSETQDSMHSETWSLLSSSTSSTKVSEVGFLKN